MATAESGIVALVFARSAAALAAAQRSLIAEAARMKREPARRRPAFWSRCGEGRRIIGHGSRRVILDHNPSAHAEKIALGCLQRRHRIVCHDRRRDLATSRPCIACEDALPFERSTYVLWCG